MAAGRGGAASLILATAASASLLLFGLVSSVDRSNFKTCNDSGFCKRLRTLDAELANPFAVDPASLKVSGDEMAATLTNTDSQVRFHAEFWALKGGVFRFKMREAYPVRERFQVPEVLVPGGPETVPLSEDERTHEFVSVSAEGGRVSAKIRFAPFQIDVFSGGRLVMTANGRGKLLFEETKPQSDGDGEAASGTAETFKSHTDSVPHGATGIRLDVAFEGASGLYGIPEHTDGFSLKDTFGGGDPYRLYNLDVFEYELNERMALYASVPFVQAVHPGGASSGLLWLNAADTWVDVSKGGGGGGWLSSGSGWKGVETTWISESGIVDVFFLAGGPSPADVSAQLGTLTGTTPLPPLFALGYHQCRWNYRDQEDVADVNAKFDEHDIPADVIWLDIEHTDGKRYFTWDANKFPNPEEMMAGLSAVGRKLVTIVDPHVKVDSRYFLYSDCKEQDLFVKDKDGNEFNGWCWPGNSAYSDFLNPAARNYYADRYLLGNYKGSTQDLHVWNDMNEPSVFNGPEVTMSKDNVHFGGVEHRDMHNVYGHLYTMATFEGVHRRGEGKLRPFVLTRSAFAGTQRYAALWTGDNTADWSHLAASIPMCLSLSIAGITFCGADVGGFFGNPDPELFVRWYQAAAFQPFFRSHAHLDTKRREPWLFAPDKMALMRDAIRTRYALLPLWYTLFYELEKEKGAPPMRPVFFEFPDEEESTTTVADLETEHMVGRALLVAPVTQQGASSWTVYLPPSAAWYEWRTGLRQAAGNVAVPVDESTVPVYQRGGTIVPTLGRVRRSTAVMMHDPYTLTVALDDRMSAEGSLYIDDGRSYDYRRGGFVYVKLAFSDNVLSGSVVKGGGGNGGLFDTPAWLELVKVVGFDGGKPKAVRMDDGTGLGFKHVPESKILLIRKPAVKLTKPKWSISIEL